MDDGRIASSRGGEINVWDPDNPETTEAVYRRHPSGSVFAMAELPDGRIASAAGPEIHIWHPDDPGTTQAIYRGHDNSEALEAVLDADNDPGDPPQVVVVSITDLVALPDGRIVSAGRDGFQNPIHIWDPDNPAEPLATRVLNEHAASLLLLADGRIADGDDSGNVTIWDPDESNDSDSDYAGHTNTVNDLIERSDGRIVSSSEDKPSRSGIPRARDSSPGRRHWRTTDAYDEFQGRRLR